MKYTLLLSIFISWNFCYAQHQFELKNASKNYDVKINVENCDDSECKGKATVELFKKSTSKNLQTLVSDNLNFYLDKDQKPTANIIQIYNEQSPLIFDDFNFDGTEDVAMRNGNVSGHSGPSYDVYVFNSAKKQFVLNDELTALAHGNLGMFNTDSERKRLITYSQSGCCWHLTTEYTVLPQRGLFKVYELEEDARGGEKVIVTRKEFIDDKWITNTKIYPINEYYKEN
ncbi:hypothetical protein SAMN05880574_11422 [Chryseobacterium sp. RU37D]|uniref:XAC2610-related protein n=1 Tax=Chryseobacterium sp. RU37D TaxID=1907397 RepID=UPI0009562933|nr:hypothetical protein [Chryseobacterium sp. RU37D]SIQ48792.1 hypothetical protein SAMN05880574_11422 [Chryseobacterium sp. RU37D]